MTCTAAVVRHQSCKPGVCVQRATPTLARTTARVDSSQTLGRRCATAGEATAGRTAPWVSYTRSVPLRWRPAAVRFQPGFNDHPAITQSVQCAFKGRSNETKLSQPVKYCLVKEYKRKIIKRTAGTNR